MQLSNPDNGRYVIEGLKKLGRRIGEGIDIGYRQFIEIFKPVQGQTESATVTRPDAIQKNLESRVADLQNPSLALYLELATFLHATGEYFDKELKKDLKEALSDQKLSGNQIYNQLLKFSAASELQKQEGEKPEDLQSAFLQIVQKGLDKILDSAESQGVDVLDVLYLLSTIIEEQDIRKGFHENSDRYKIGKEELKKLSFFVENNKLVLKLILRVPQVHKQLDDSILTAIGNEQLKRKIKNHLKGALEGKIR